ncbi:MAG: hypothetical protein QM571_00425 [Micrococcaceae bacterium]
MKITQISRRENCSVFVKAPILKNLVLVKLNQNQRHALRTLAHLDALKNVTISHVSAAVVHNLNTIYLKQVTHFIVNKRRTSKNESLKFHFYKSNYEVTKLFGVPITSIEQTVIDCAKTLSFAESIVSADSALRKGVTKNRLRELASNMDQARYQKKIGKVIDSCTSLSESAGESLARVMLMALELPVPKLQYKFSTPTRNYYTDFYFSDLFLIVEFDGMEKYQGKCQKPEQVFINERARDEVLFRKGISVIHFTWSELHRPVVMMQKFQPYMDITLQNIIHNYQRCGIEIYD